MKSHVRAAAAIFAAFIVFTFASEVTIASDCGEFSTITVPSSGGGSGSITDPTELTDVEPDDPVNLKQDTDIIGQDGNELYAGHNTLLPGMKVNVRVTGKAKGGDAGNWKTRDDADTIDIAYYVSYDDGEWTQFDTGYMTIAKLDEDVEITETKSLTIPDGIVSVAFRIDLDYRNEVEEYDEGDNKSRVERFEVSTLKPNLTPTNVFLSNADNGTHVYDGDHILEDQYWHMYCDIESNGDIDSPIGIKVSHKIDGEERYTDTLGIDEIHLGETATEVAWDDMKLGDTGSRTQECCVDSGNWLPETNESDNCKTMHFTVDPWKSDITVADLYLVTDTGQVVRNGSSIPENSYVRPYCTLTNQGNRDAQNGIRLKYEVDAGNYRGDDGLDAADLKIGQSKTEYMSTSFRLGDTGNRTFRCIGDYENSEHELNEGNNQATISFTVYKAVPQITIDDIYVVQDGNVIRNGGTGKKGRKYHPNVSFHNSGTGNMSCGARARYYIDWNTYRDDDGIDPLAVGQGGHEYVSNDNIKLGKSGTRSYRVTIDSDCNELPHVEGTIWFTVR